MKGVNRIEKFIYRKAELVSTITLTMKERICSKGIDENKLFLLRNWINMADFHKNPGGNEFRKEHGLEEKFVFLYSGNIGKKQGLEYLIDAASGILDKNIVFVIAGTGANIANLRARAEALDLRNLRFFSLQPEEKLPEMLAAADVCLVIQKRTMGDIAFPSKMVNIMAAGRPLLVTADPNTELAQAVVESGCGFIAKPEDADDLRKTILQAYSDGNLQEKGERATSYANKHFGREEVFSRLTQLFAPQNAQGSRWKAKEIRLKAQG